MFCQAQRSCHSCVPRVAFLWEKCRRHFRHGSSPQILTQLLEITPMDRYLYLLGRNSCASLPPPRSRTVLPCSQPETWGCLCLPNPLQHKCSDSSAKQGCYPFFTLCTFRAYAVMFLFPLQSSYRAQMVPGLLHQTSELLRFLLMPVLVQTVEGEELFNW